MLKTEFILQYKQKTEYVNQVLLRYLPKEQGLQQSLFEAMNYSILAGGKRLRPILAAETYALFSKHPRCEVIEPFLCAIEMIHTYSLVHDDLPAMDNDAVRRGMPTTHAKFGHAMGILAGDALLNFAAETAVTAFRKGLLYTKQNERTARALKLLFEKAGAYGMVGGQAVDILMSGKISNEETLSWMYENKTCALIEASFMTGAALAGAKEAELNQLSHLGHLIGTAFQIKDDILDVTGSLKELGKPIHSDETNQKYTYVSLYGIEKAEETVSAFSKEAVALLDTLPGKHDFLCELIMFLADREK